MNKLIDMHIHTIYSDGERSPEDIIKLSKENNIGTFSITDHDTVLGVQQIYNDYQDDDLKFIPGIELTGSIDKGRLHILGYGIDPFNDHLNSIMDELRDNSMKRVAAIVNYIKEKYNIVFQDDDLHKMYQAVGNIGRPDIAKLCMKYGYVKTTKEAFQKYLIEAYDAVARGTGKLSAKECIELISEAGGIPVLAHPISLEKSYQELEAYLIELIAYGLRGVEAYHSLQTPPYTEMLLALADQYHLLVSGGSDYHGPILKPDVMIGTGIDHNIYIKKLSILKHL